MRRILFAAAVWLFGCAGALAQQTGPIYCGQQATQSTVSTKLEVVQGSGSATLPALGGTSRIYVCGYTVSVTAAANVTFQYGTGTNCGTGSTAVGPTLQFAAAGTFSDTSPAYRGFFIPSSQSLCATASAGTAAVTIYYAQQ